MEEEGREEQGEVGEKVKKVGGGVRGRMSGCPIAE
jgi:hypothetical protein